MTALAQCRCGNIYLLYAVLELVKKAGATVDVKVIFAGQEPLAGAAEAMDADDENAAAVVAPPVRQRRNFRSKVKD